MLDPVLIAYTATRTTAGKTIWSRIGEAYPHETGAGLTLKLAAVPFDGIVILLELDEKDHRRLTHEATRIVGPNKRATGASGLRSPTGALSTNEVRMARRLLRERDRHSFTSIELAVLRSVVDTQDAHTPISRHDLALARRLFLALRRKLS